MLVEVSKHALGVEARLRATLALSPRFDELCRLHEVLDDGVVVRQFRALLAHRVNPRREHVHVLVHQGGRERHGAEVAETEVVGISLGDGVGVVETAL